MTKNAGVTLVTLQTLAHLTQESVTYLTCGSAWRTWLRQSSCQAPFIRTEKTVLMFTNF